MIDFSAKQKAVWRNTIHEHHRWNISLGATRSGKTYLDYYRIPFRIRRAPEDGLIMLLGNTKGTLERNILAPMRGIWTDELVGHIGSDNRVQLFGRSCYALGADKVTQVSRLQGTGIAYCYGDEIATWSEQVFAMLKSRLDKPGACFDGTCNPEGPSHWFKQFLDSGADIYQMAFTIDDNPFLAPEFVSALKAEYTGTVYYDRYILGRWALAEGLIYPMFSAERNVTACIPEGGRWYISIDYGTYNPFSAGLWCVAEGRAYRVAEYYYSGRNGSPKTDEEYYTELDRLAGERPVERVIIDPSASSMIETIKRHGRFRVRQADNNVAAGIPRVAALLNVGRIQLHPGCKDAIREFGLYSWDDKAQGDKPIKDNDHAMDDIRYFVNTVLAREFRWMDWG